MIINRKFLQVGLLVLLFMFMAVAPAEAADVFGTVRSRAVNFLKQLKPVIFILAGFGLIGFAWMAVFGQLSWKWFANIAMGLFLVANMGIFIDYFATVKGDPGKYAELGQAHYKDHLGGSGNYQGTSGTASDPSNQTSSSNEGTGGPSSSDDLENVSGNGGESPSSTSSAEECTKAGGVWENGSCSKKGSSGESGTSPNTSPNNEDESTRAKRDICEALASEGKIWNGSSCVTAPGYIACNAQGRTWNPSTQACE